jgi:lipid II:glycine glycyltransferase (peptidoglycan interpeptide bridge formation enzyme)
MVRRRALVNGLSSCASMPYGWGEGGLISTVPLQSQDVREVLSDLQRWPGLQISVRPSPLVTRIWEAGIPPGVNITRRMTHVLDLEGGFDQVWNKRFPSSTRTKIRKAEKCGLTVQCDTSGSLVPTVYEIYLKWTARRARERQIPLSVAEWIARQREPYEKFQLTAKMLGEMCRIWLILRQDQPVAAAILLIYQEHAHYWRSWSIRELAAPVRANDLLQNLLIQDACEHNCQYYHMGESGGVASLMHFKSRFGAHEIPFSVYTLEHLPIAPITNHLFGLLKGVEHRLIREKD